MASNNIPYFRFYPADFMLGVRGMSAQEVGVYTMIICLIYESSGPVEYNPLRLSTYCGMRQATFDKVLEKLVDLDKLQMHGGLISNRRADVEISKRANDLKSNSKAGKASAEKRQQNQSQAATDVEHTFNHTDTDTDTDKKEEDMGKPISPAEKPPAKARMPVGWMLSDEGWTYARSQGIPDKVIEDEARGFQAYWADRRDRDASKSERGWEQCWANRCRSIAGRYSGRIVAGGPASGRYGQGSSIASIVARRRASGEI